MNHKFITFFLGLTALSLLGLRVWWGRPLLSFNHINCQLQAQPCPQELAAQSQTLKNRSLFFTAIEQEVADWQLDLYQLESYQKTWPGQLKLQFVSEPSLYQLQLPDRLITLTTSGFIKDTAQDSGKDQEKTSLPVVVLAAESNRRLVEELEQQAQLSNELHQPLADLVNQLDQLNLQISRINYQTDLIKLYLDSDLVALAEPTNLQKQLQRLALIENDLNLDQIDLAIKEIDLRYELPVLRTQLSQ